MKKILVPAALALAGIASAAPVVVDFELLADGYNAGGLYAPGVSFAYGAVTSGLNLGDTVVIPLLNSGIYGFSGTLAWSPDTVGYAPGTSDLMMTFGTRITFASVLVDKYSPDNPDVVQLAALDDNFKVVSLMSINDDGANANNPAANYLQVSSANPFKYELFVSTTEQEGIDDLTYNPVPEPITMALGAGALGLALRRRRKN